MTEKGKIGRPHTPNRQGLYAKIAKYVPDIIQRTFELTKSSNDNVALGACRTLLERVLPAHKAISLIIDDKTRNLLTKLREGEE